MVGGTIHGPQGSEGTIDMVTGEACLLTPKGKKRPIPERSQKVIMGQILEVALGMKALRDVIMQLEAELGVPPEEPAPTTDDTTK